MPFQVFFHAWMIGSILCCLEHTLWDAQFIDPKIWWWPEHSIWLNIFLTIKLSNKRPWTISSVPGWCMGNTILGRHQPSDSFPNSCQKELWTQKNFHKLRTPSSRKSTSAHVRKVPMKNAKSRIGTIIDEPTQHGIETLIDSLLNSLWVQGDNCAIVQIGEVLLFSSVN